MNRKPKCVLAAILLLFFVGTLLASDGNTAVTDPVKVQRLAGLGKLWGALKYFHPYLAYKDIDWDLALVQTIPKVEAANSAEEYRAAIDYLLSFLQDPNTVTVGEKGGKSEHSTRTSQTPPQPYIQWTKDQVAIIVANDYNQFAGSTEKAALLRKVFEESSKATALVFDIRNKETVAGEDFTFWFSTAFLQTFPVFLNKDLPLSGSRSRMHSGYATQTGGAYGGYSSAFVTSDGGVMRAQGQGKAAKPMALVIDAGTAGVQALLAGLQSAGLATVVLEGKAGMESGVEGYLMKLPEGVRVSMRTNEMVNPDGTVGFSPDLVVPGSGDTSVESNPAIMAAVDLVRGSKAASTVKRQTAPLMVTGKLEKPYRDMAYPIREYRLLSLFRFWNVINYFFPYKHLIDRPWDDVLAEFIPKLEEASDSLQYHLTVARLVTQIHDTHGFMGSQVLSNYLGTFSPPIEVKSVQGKTVVTYLFDDTIHKSTGLSVGDIVLSVDGEEIGKRRARIGDLFAASTPQALRWRTDRAVLGGPENSRIELEIQNAEGKVQKVILSRSAKAKRPTRAYPVYTVLPSGFGYIDLERLTPEDVDRAFEALKNTPAIIFDDRGYPRGTFPFLAPHFVNKEVVAARFERPTPQSPDMTQESRLRFAQMTEPGDKDLYKGKVVVLINEDAISQSEHTGLFLEATAHALFVGSPTNGANGDVTQTVLPGGITVNFSGHDVRHADGRQLQRKGLQPDVLVEPTIKGIREGKDEVMEKAVEFLKKGGKRL
jgi:C-terminal processing protease CtpA/Prc